MTTEDYVRFRIVKLAKKPDGTADYHGERTLLYQVDLPRWLWLHRQRALSWISNRFGYFHPFDHLSTSLSFFDHKTGADIGLHSATARLTAAKGQVTKIENAIAQYVASFKPTLFSTDPTTTDAYRKAVDKLAIKKAELMEAQANVLAETQKLDPQ